MYFKMEWRQFTTYYNVTHLNQIKLMRGWLPINPTKVRYYRSQHPRRRKLVPDRGTPSQGGLIPERNVIERTFRTLSVFDQYFTSTILLVNLNDPLRSVVVHWGGSGISWSYSETSPPNPVLRPLSSPRPLSRPPYSRLLLLRKNEDLWTPR